MTSNAPAHREPPTRALSRSAEPPPGGDAVQRWVRRVVSTVLLLPRSTLACLPLVSAFSPSPVRPVIAAGLRAMASVVAGSRDNTHTFRLHRLSTASLSSRLQPGLTPAVAGRRPDAPVRFQQSRSRAALRCRAGLGHQPRTASSRAPSLSLYRLGSHSSLAL
jgi:hypothetical protein